MNSDTVTADNDAEDTSSTLLFTVAGVKSRGVLLLGEEGDDDEPSSGDVPSTGDDEGM